MSHVLKIEKYLKKIQSFHNLFSGFRFVVTVALLAFIVSYVGKKSYLDWFYGALIFIFVFLLFNKIHRKIKSKLRYWTALSKSFQQHNHRMARHFDKLILNHKDFYEFLEQNKYHNFYALDLDVNKSLFPLLNSCSTKEGALKLFHELNFRGNNPLTKEEKASFQDAVLKVSKEHRMLRLFESFRFRDDLDPQIFQTEVSYVYDSESKIETETSFFLNKTIKIIACMLFLLFWFVCVPLNLYKYLYTLDLNDLNVPVMFLVVSLIFYHVILSKESSEFLQLSKKIHTYHDLVLFLKSWKKHPLPFNFFSASFSRYSWLSVLIAKIYEFRSNPVFSIFVNLFLPVDSFATMTILIGEKKFRKLESDFRKEICNFDYVCAIARFHNENREFKFNSYLSEGDSFTLKKVGHPLLSKAKRICNNITLSKNQNTYLITGSNMSGKSTFLRTIGLNVLLSNMGAPVCASSFELPPLSVLCSIRVDDSLESGFSFFYSEVKRLKAVLDQVSSSPSFSILFLIDEIFRGTNNKERYIGSYHLIKALTSKDQFGLISTHDLELTKLEDENSHIKNVHFTDTVKENILIFDYTLKNGACPSSNALFIMKAEGLPVSLTSL